MNIEYSPTNVQFFGVDNVISGTKKVLMDIPADVCNKRYAMKA